MATAAQASNCPKKRVPQIFEFRLSGTTKIPSRLLTTIRIYKKEPGLAARYFNSSEKLVVAMEGPPASGESTNPTLEHELETASTTTQAPSAEKIQEFLKSKDDTSRFVGLALLKSVIDNSAALRQDEASILELWESISPKFLDRLLKSGQKGSRDMLDLAVSVIHTFSRLLPDEARRQSRLTGRVSPLVAALLKRYTPFIGSQVSAERLAYKCNSSKSTTDLILQTLQNLTSFPEGAAVFLTIEDLSPLLELVPSHRESLTVLSFAWLNGMGLAQVRSSLPPVIDKTISQLVVSFKGTDAVTLMEFLGNFARKADPQVRLTSDCHERD